MVLRYHGNSPYCIANSLTVLFGDDGPGPAVLEVAGGSPFGIAVHQVGDDETIYFSSPIWRPEFGIANAMDIAGWTSERVHGDLEHSLAVLRGASQDAPVLVGPIEMGLLPYVPGLGQAVGADHNLIVFGVQDETVVAHDVIWLPYVTVQVDDLVKTWEGTTFAYPADAYAIRSGFRRVREVGREEIVRRVMQTALAQLDAPGIAEAAQRAAQIVEGELSNMQYKYLVEFQIHVGARRLADAAWFFDSAGLAGPAAILEHQAALVGSLQLSLMTHDAAKAAATFRALGPTYARLRDSIAAELG